MCSIYSYIFCLEILLLLYNLHIFASDQINEESNNKKMFFSNFWETFVTNMYKKQLLTFLSNFWATFWEITGNFLGNLEQLVESPSRDPHFRHLILIVHLIKCVRVIQIENNRIQQELSACQHNYRPFVDLLQQWATRGSRMTLNSRDTKQNRRHFGYDDKYFQIFSWRLTLEVREWHKLLKLSFSCWESLTFKNR